MSSHVVQIDERQVAALVVDKTMKDLAAGNNALLIVAAARAAMFRKELAARFLDVAAAIAAGRLVITEAEALVQALEADPSLDRLVAAIEAVAPRATADGRFVYDETTALLGSKRVAERAAVAESWRVLGDLWPETLVWSLADGPSDVVSVVQPRPERRLQESERRMALLIASIRDYAIFMLDPTGHIATWNPGAQGIKGYLAEEIIGKHFSVFYPQADIDDGKCERELRIASETGRFEEEGWRLRKDGSRFWANVVISAVRDDERNLVGFAKVTRDLTERQRAEKQRTELLAAEHANRAKDEFLAMLGHELRNPLAPIVSALQLMRLREDAQEVPEHAIIERHVEHVVRLVDDLLDVARITQKKIELVRTRIQLADIVTRALEIARGAIDQKRHRIVLDVSHSGLSIEGDTTRLVQVVANLLGNAAKYTPPGGSIELTGRSADGNVVLEVKDNGEGLPPELLPRVFDLFVQGERAADRSQGGLGIGLTLVRSLVQLHGGTVSVDSAGRGQGSRFVVTLPAAVEAPSPAAGAPGPARARTTTPRRVLVVDDNIDAAVMLGQLLGMMGHDVRTAHEGADALRVLDDFTPEVAILDIGLPGMDGLELARRMRGRLGAGCRLVALTGYGQEDDRQRSEQAGFDEHLVKPVTAAQLRAVLGPA